MRIVYSKTGKLSARQSEVRLRRQERNNYSKTIISFFTQTRQNLTYTFGIPYQRQKY